MSAALSAWVRACEAIFVIHDNGQRVWLVVNHAFGNGSDHLMRSWAQLPEAGEMEPPRFVAFSSQLSSEEKSKLYDGRLRLDDPESVFDYLLHPHRPGRWQQMAAGNEAGEHFFPPLDRMDIAVALNCVAVHSPAENVTRSDDQRTALLYARSEMWAALF